MNTFFGGRFGQTPPVVKNLIIINVLMLLATFIFRATFNYDITRPLALYYPGSDLFSPYQYVTHMFLHGGLTHLFFNMFALWMFGRILEQVWGSQRFLLYYFVTGIGAAAFYTLTNWIEFSSIYNSLEAYANTPTLEGFRSFIREEFPQFKSRIIQDSAYQQITSAWAENPGNNQVAERSIQYLQSVIRELKNIPIVGASGAVFGVLLAFGMLFPNTQLMLLFPPIPIKAKYFVIMYGALELYLGLSQRGSSIAHFAHLGGMLFGFILIKYWSNKRSQFY